MVPARLWATHLYATECTFGEYWCSANGEKTRVPFSSTCIRSLTPLTVEPSSTVCQRTSGLGVPSAAHSTRAPVAFEKKTDTGGSTTKRGPCSSPPYPRAEIRKKTVVNDFDSSSGYRIQDKKYHDSGVFLDKEVAEIKAKITIDDIESRTENNLKKPSTTVAIHCVLYILYTFEKLSILTDQLPDHIWSGLSSINPLCDNIYCRHSCTFGVQ
ncbi:hypothetical protein QTP88_006993 [Uroleucon formosanum]